MTTRTVGGSLSVTRALPLRISLRVESRNSRLWLLMSSRKAPLVTPL